VDYSRRDAWHYRNAVIEIEPDLAGIVTEPGFAIGQRAHLISTPAGNLLWDCVSYLDDETVAEVKRRGGIAAIAISHPHFQSAVVEWSRAFGGVPVHIHADNAPWIVRTDPAIAYWSGETLETLPGLTIVRCGGHFPGSSALHWAAGAGGRGALFTGDTIYPVADPRWVSFMYSYPNLIPLDAESVRRIVTAVEPYAFDRLYAAWDVRTVAARREGGRPPLRRAVPGPHRRIARAATPGCARPRTGPPRPGCRSPASRRSGTGGPEWCAG
jgi:glyoxylase-like metal-dependent hydrolase (beta-lactamase superfamily II)